MVPTVMALGSSRFDAWQPCAWSMMTCQKLATALATLILLTPWSYSWTANQRPGNMPVHSLCGASLMQVVLYSIAPKDNLHYTSVFPLTISAGLTSLYHQQQWLPLMTRTVLVKAAAGAPHRLASEPARTLPRMSSPANMAWWPLWAIEIDNWKQFGVYHLDTGPFTYFWGGRMCAC